MGMIRKTRGRPRKHHEIIEREMIWCCKCGSGPHPSNSNVIDLVCGDCFQLEILCLDAADKREKATEKGRPRGWHRRKLFVSEDGKTYSFGKEIENVKKRRKSKRNPAKILSR